MPPNGEISIHALREEGDKGPDGRFAIHEAFLSTPSARRATLLTVPPTSIKEVFLSTPSARRATQQAEFTDLSNKDFYPRPPRGGRRIF